MSDDIIFSTAWNCGDKDCKVGWHKASYWINSDGYTVDNYSDGDHDEIDEKDLPSNEEIERSWREYARDVAATGEDPLEEYYVKRAIKVRERWEFKFNNSILGPVLYEARYAGRKVLPVNLPAHVKSYLNLDKGARKLSDFARWINLEEALPGVKPMKWMSFHIEHDKPRNAATVAHELKRIARRKLKGKVK